MDDHHRRHHCRPHIFSDHNFQDSPMWQMRFISKLFGMLILKQGEESPTHGTFVLFLLIDGEKRLQRDQKELASCLQVTPATITGMLKRLKKSGLIQKKEDPSDLRRNLIELSDEGYAAVMKHRNMIERLEETALKGISIEERNVLRGQLQRIQHNLQAEVGYSSSSK